MSIFVCWLEGREGRRKWVKARMVIFRRYLRLTTIALHTILFASAVWIADKFLHEIPGLSRYFQCLIHLKVEVVE